MKSKEDKTILDEKKFVSRERIRRRSPSEVKMGWRKIDLLTKVIMVRIKMDSFKKLNKIAEEECRTMASVVRQAIKEHLENR